MSVLKILGVIFAQVVLGPIAGPVGLGAWIWFGIAAAVSWGSPVVGVFGGFFAGQTAGLILAAVLWFSKRPRGPATSEPAGPGAGGNRGL